MRKYTPFYKAISVAIAIIFTISSFGVTPNASAQMFSKPLPQNILHLTQPFEPILLKGIKVDPQNPLQFDFIINEGFESNSGVASDLLEHESAKLIKYFLASLAIPESDLWVNLSPYEKERIIPEAFGQTEMGRDLLAQDYLLKQLTASLLNPDGEYGSKFWEKVHANTQMDIPVETFHKIWIMPERAKIYEGDGVAYVMDSKFKVMLEKDYVAQEKHNAITANEEHNPLDETAEQAMRDIVIPAIEQEINQGKHFAQLRQIYSAFILATWYKKKMQYTFLNQIYADSLKIKGVDHDDPQAPTKIWEEYKQIFETGAYDAIKEEYDPVTQDIIPRKYFTGGAIMAGEFDSVKASAASMTGSKNLHQATVRLGMEAGTASAAMTAKEYQLKLMTTMNDFADGLIAREKPPLDTKIEKLAWEFLEGLKYLMVGNPKELKKLNPIKLRQRQLRFQHALELLRAQYTHKSAQTIAESQSTHPIRENVYILAAKYAPQYMEWQKESDIVEGENLDRREFMITSGGAAASTFLEKVFKRVATTISTHRLDALDYLTTKGKAQFMAKTLSQTGEGYIGPYGRGKNSKLVHDNHIYSPEGGVSNTTVIMNLVEKLVMSKQNEFRLLVERHRKEAMAWADLELKDFYRDRDKGGALDAFIKNQASETMFEDIMDDDVEQFQTPFFDDLRFLLRSIDREVLLMIRYVHSLSIEEVQQLNQEMEIRPDQQSSFSVEEKAAELREEITEKRNLLLLYDSKPSRLDRTRKLVEEINQLESSFKPLEEIIRLTQETQEFLKRPIGEDGPSVGEIATGVAIVGGVVATGQARREKSKAPVVVTTELDEKAAAMAATPSKADPAMKAVIRVVVGLFSRLTGKGDGGQAQPRVHSIPATTLSEGEVHSIPMTTQSGRLFNSQNMITEFLGGRKATVYDIGPGWFHGRGPITSIELAEALRGNQRVVAIDYVLPAYEANDGDNVTVTFGNDGEVISYKQFTDIFPASRLTSEQTQKARRLFEELQPKLEPGKRRYTSKKGETIISDPILEYGHRRMVVRLGDIFTFKSTFDREGLPKARIVRIANAFVRHIELERIQEALIQLYDFVEDNGVVLIGIAGQRKEGILGEEYLHYQKTESGFRLTDYGVSFRVEGGNFGITEEGANVFSPVRNVGLFTKFEQLLGTRAVNEIDALYQSDRSEKKLGALVPATKIVAKHFRRGLDINVSAVGSMLHFDIKSLQSSSNETMGELWAAFKRIYLDQGAPVEVKVDDFAMTTSKNLSQAVANTTSAAMSSKAADSAMLTPVQILAPFQGKRHGDKINWDDIQNRSVLSLRDELLDKGINDLMFYGGVTRNTLVGREVGKDYDMVLELNIDDLIEDFIEWVSLLELSSHSKAKIVEDAIEMVSDNDLQDIMREFKRTRPEGAKAADREKSHLSTLDTSHQLHKTFKKALEKHRERIYWELAKKQIRILEEKLGLEQGAVLGKRAYWGNRIFEIIAIKDQNGRMYVTEGEKQATFIPELQESINTIGLRLDGEIDDPYGGMSDLENGILRIIDPLTVGRKFFNHQTVFRLLRFRYEFGLTLEQSTGDLLRYWFDGSKDDLFFERNKYIKEFVDWLEAYWTLEDVWRKLASKNKISNRDKQKMKKAKLNFLRRLMPIFKEKHVYEGLEKATILLGDYNVNMLRKSDSWGVLKDIERQIQRRPMEPLSSLLKDVWSSSRDYEDSVSRERRKEEQKGVFKELGIGDKFQVSLYASINFFEDKADGMDKLHLGWYVRNVYLGALKNDADLREVTHDLQEIGVANTMLKLANFNLNEVEERVRAFGKGGLDQLQREPDTYEWSIAAAMTTASSKADPMMTEEDLAQVPTVTELAEPYPEHLFELIRSEDRPHVKSVLGDIFIPSEKLQEFIPQPSLKRSIRNSLRNLIPLVSYNPGIVSKKDTPEAAVLLNEFQARKLGIARKEVTWMVSLFVILTGISFAYQSMPFYYDRPDPMPWGLKAAAIVYVLRLAIKFIRYRVDPGYGREPWHLIQPLTAMLDSPEMVRGSLQGIELISAINMIKNLEREVGWKIYLTNDPNLMVWPLPEQNAFIMNHAFFYEWQLSEFSEGQTFHDQLRVGPFTAIGRVIDWLRSTAITAGQEVPSYPIGYRNAVDGAVAQKYKFREHEGDPAMMALAVILNDKSFTLEEGSEADQEKAFSSIEKIHRYMGLEERSYKAKEAISEIIFIKNRFDEILGYVQLISDKNTATIVLLDEPEIGSRNIVRNVNEYDQLIYLRLIVEVMARAREKGLNHLNLEIREKEGSRGAFYPKLEQVVPILEAKEQGSWDNVTVDLSTYEETFTEANRVLASMRDGGQGLEGEEVIELVKKGEAPLEVNFSQEKFKNDFDEAAEDVLQFLGGESIDQIIDYQKEQNEKGKGVFEYNLTLLIGDSLKTIQFFSKSKYPNTEAEIVQKGSGIITPRTKVFSYKNSKIMIMHKAEGVDLDNFNITPGDKEAVLKLTKAIAEALGKLHKLGFTHNELKGRHIYVDTLDSGELKVTFIDFENGISIDSPFYDEHTSIETENEGIIKWFQMMYTSEEDRTLQDEIERVFYEHHDAAMLNDPNVGGIDLDSSQMEFAIEGGAGVDCLQKPDHASCIQLEFTPEQIQDIRNNLIGITPTIINIQPLPSLPIFLGLDESKEGKEEQLVQSIDLVAVKE